MYCRGGVQLTRVEVYSVLRWRCAVYYGGGVQCSAQEVCSVLQRRCAVYYGGGVQFTAVDVCSLLQWRCVAYWLFFRLGCFNVEYTAEKFNRNMGDLVQVSVQVLC